MADVVTEARERLSARLTELEPLVREHENVQRALAALEETVRPASSSATAGRGSNGATTRRRRTTTRRSASSGRGRSGPTRKEQFLAELAKEPEGLSIREVAGRLGMDRYTQLYPLAKGLQADGLVENVGEGRWKLTRQSGSPEPAAQTSSTSTRKRTTTRSRSTSNRSRSRAQSSTGAKPRSSRAQSGGRSRTAGTAKASSPSAGEKATGTDAQPATETAQAGGTTEQSQ